MLRLTRRSFAVALTAALVTSSVGRAYAPCGATPAMEHARAHGTHGECEQLDRSAQTPTRTAHAHHAADAGVTSTGQDHGADHTTPNAECLLGLHCSAQVMVPTLAVTATAAAGATTAALRPSLAPRDPATQPDSPPPKA